MKRLLIFWGILLGFGFTISELPAFISEVAENFKVLGSKRLQEKIWLHTDKECYDVGDKLWFRAFLVDAATHVESPFSNFVYVELVNPQDSVLRRLKIARIDSVFSGYLNVTSDIRQGEYFLRAYSYWMQNIGEDFICKKKIEVVNPQDSRVLTGVNYEKKDSIDYAVIRLTNSRNEPYQRISVNWKMMDDAYDGKTHKARTDEEGKIRIPLKRLANPGDVLLQFSEAATEEFKRYVHLPDNSGDFDIAFFPEGGDLIPGNEQKVAYKAIGTDGWSMDVKGIFYAEDGSVIDIVQSYHRGMGFVYLKAEPGKRYYVEVESPQGIRKKVYLPESNPKGLGLTVQPKDSVLRYRIIGGPETVVPDSLYLLIHMRGMLYACTSVDGAWVGEIPLKTLPEGILHICLVDDKARIYSQRLCFVRQKSRPEIIIRPDKKGYHAREAVDLELQLKGQAGMSGSFSVAVTDDATVKRDSLGDDIVSDLLLSSDLKGYVEDPRFYFRDVTKATDRCLDLLLLTQGWTRFDVSKIISGDFGSSPYYLERGQAISGRVKNFWGKEAGEAKLVLFSSNQILRFLDADSAGYFVIDGVSFPDSTSFVVQAQSRKGRKSVEVIVDKDQFLAPKIRIPYERTEADGEDDFYKKYGRDYYYDNGVKVFVLDEAVVERNVPKKVYSFYDNMARYSIDSTTLASTKFTLETMLMTEFPGVLVINKEVTYQGKKIAILLDEMEQNYEFISMMDPKEFLSISMLDEMMGKFYLGESGQNGALVFTRNWNYVPERLGRLNIQTFTAFGYQKPVEFYMPRYDVDSVRMAMADTMDVRKTIYWNPKVKISSTEPTRLRFFTDDGCEHATLILEGVLKDGTVCRKEQKIRLKVR